MRRRNKFHVVHNRFIKVNIFCQVYLGDIESGIKEPSYNFLKKLLEATGISSEWILRGTGPMMAETSEPEEGKVKDSELLAEAALEKLDCGLYASGERVYVPMSSVTACCGSGFNVFEEYNLRDAMAVNKKQVGILRSDMVPYAVQTEGRSMEGYGVREGSIVVINPAEDIFSGCVAMVIYDDKASIKKVYDTPDGKNLISSSGQKIHVTHEELAEEWGPRICGRVMVVISPPDDGI